MRSYNRVTMLLIEGDATCRHILLNAIAAEFPSIDVIATASPHEALQLLETKQHDIVVCDALIARDERIGFTWHMCTEADPIVIVITADTDLHKDSFPPDIKDVCVVNVTYKPVDLNDLMQEISDAIKRVEVREGGGETELVRHIK